MIKLSPRWFSYALLSFWLFLLGLILESRIDSLSGVEHRILSSSLIPLLLSFPITNLTFDAVKGESLAY